MSENEHDQDTRNERQQRAGITEELEWEALEHEQPSAPEAGAGALPVIELPDKQRPSIRRRAGRASGAPAQRAAGGVGLSWPAAAAAVVLAACAGATVALAISGSPAHLYKPKPSMSATPRSVVRRPHTRLEHHRRTWQRVKTPRARSPSENSSESGPVPLPRAPATNAEPSPASPPAPPPPADTEGQAQGGPFSP